MQQLDYHQRYVQRQLYGERDTDSVHVCICVCVHSFKYTWYKFHKQPLANHTLQINIIIIKLYSPFSCVCFIIIFNRVD